jgi:hypothetical protein
MVGLGLGADFVFVFRRERVGESVLALGFVSVRSGGCGGCEVASGAGGRLCVCAPAWRCGWPRTQPIHCWHRGIRRHPLHHPQARVGAQLPCASSALTRAGARGPAGPRAKPGPPPSGADRNVVPAHTKSHSAPILTSRRSPDSSHAAPHTPGPAGPARSPAHSSPRARVARPAREWPTGPNSWANAAYSAPRSCPILGALAALGGQLRRPNTSDPT